MSTWIPPLVPPVVETLWLPLPNSVTDMEPFTISQLENQLKKNYDDVRSTAAPVLVGMSHGATPNGGDGSGSASRNGEAEGVAQGGRIDDGDDDEEMMEREGEGEDGEEEEEEEEEGVDEFGSDEMSEDGSGYADLEQSGVGGEAGDSGEGMDEEDDDDDGLAGYL